MAHILWDDFWFCTDCTQVACNGSRGLDLTAQRIEEIEHSLQSISGHIVSNFDSETRDGLREFSGICCDSCGSHLAGYRARFAVLD